MLSYWITHSMSGTCQKNKCSSYEVSVVNKSDFYIQYVLQEFQLVIMNHYVSQQQYQQWPGLRVKPRMDGIFSLTTISDWILWSYSLLTNGTKVPFRLWKVGTEWNFVTSVWTITVWCLGTGRTLLLIQCFGKLRNTEFFYGKPEDNKVGQLGMCRC